MPINKRENDILENYKAYKELNKARAEKIDNTNKALAEQNNAFLKNYYNKIDKRRIAERSHGKNITEARNYFFGNALKGIYIGALEAATLNDEGIFLAEQMVDSYISENGGYDTIMSNVKSDTYLLAKIRRLVEDAAEDEVNNLESEENDIEKTDDIEIKEFPEDEKDDVEVAGDTKLTTANITDIVSALNKAGLEVVKTNGDADNFKESEPESDTNKPELDVDVNVDDTTDGTEEDINIEEKPETSDTSEEDTTADINNEPTTDAEPTTDNKDMSFNDNDKSGSVDTATTEAPNTPDAATEEIKPEENSESSDTEEEVSDDEDNELDNDLAAVEDSDESEEEKVAEDDNLDPDTVAVNDDESEDEDIDIDIEDDEDDDLGEDESDEDDNDSTDEESEEDDIEDIDVDGDGDDDFGDVDEPDDTVNVDPNKTMMDELENEKEVQDAIELIRNRVADAEEAFIKRNQEDKQKMDELLSKISHNVATVEKIAGDNSDKAESDKKTLEESTRMYKQKINEMSQKSTTIFNKMTRNISESIIKDPKKVELFLDESGTPDFGLITETAKVMYAFLETLNTLQLEKVDGNYISKAIAGLI